MAGQAEARNGLQRDGSHVDAEQRFGYHWQTEWSRRLVDLDEIAEIGLTRGAAPAIQEPGVISVDDAQERLHNRMPVAAVQVGGEMRAYPLDVLVSHEVVNDVLGGTPIVATYDSPTASVAVYGRTMGDEEHRFASAGLRHRSGGLLYDMTTESLWEQLNGRCVVGDRVGVRLPWAHSLTLAWRRFADEFPDATVLAPEGSALRDYGRTPWVGYDNPRHVPPHAQVGVDRRSPALERVVAAMLGDETEVYAYEHLAERGGINNDDRGENQLVVFWVGDVLDTLAAERIENSHEVGTAVVYRRPVYKGSALVFEPLEQ